MNSILVTGGAGFIGSNFVRYMINKYPSYKIIVLDALTYAGNLENLDDLKEKSNYEFHHGNICDKTIVDKLVSSVDEIIDPINRLTHSLKMAQCPVILVSNEVGAGIVPENQLARLFRDITGTVNQKLAECTGKVVWMVAGIPVTVKPKSKTP